MKEFDIERLIYFFNKVLNYKDIKNVAKFLIKELKHIFNIEHYALYINKDFSTPYNFRIEYSSDLPEDLKEKFQSFYDEAIVYFAINDNKIKFIPDIDEGSDSIKYFIMPFVDKSRVIGYLIAYGEFNESKITSNLEKYLNYLTYLSAVVIENVYLFQEEDSINQHLTNIIEFGKDIFSKIEEKEIISKFIELLKREFKYDELFIIEKYVKEDEAGIKFIYRTSPIEIKNNNLRILSRKVNITFIDKNHHLFYELKKYFNLNYAIILHITLSEKDKLFAIIGYKKPEEIFFRSSNKTTIEYLEILLTYLKLAINNTRLLKSNIKAKEEIEQKNLQLFQASKMAAIGDFASGIAHEINTPLQIIMGRLQLISIKTKDEDLLKDINIIYEETKRIASLIRNLLEFARGGKDSEEDFGEIDLREIIDSVLGLLEHQIEKDNIKIRKRGWNKEKIIIGHSNSLKQVFLNLINNSRQALMEWDGKKEIKLCLEEKENKIIAKVIDTGPGIPKDNIEKIFHPFFSTKEFKGGIGLGLALVYNIVQKHNGRIKVKSIPGVRTTFTLEFPKVK